MLNINSILSFPATPKAVVSLNLRVLVIGAGISGCTVAYTLANQGSEVILIESTGNIGGKVRSYGCKAIEKCQNCGVCLTVGLWNKVSAHQNINILTNTNVKDITGNPGDFAVIIADSQTEQRLDGIDVIIISTGFESQTNGISSHLHIEDTNGLITGTQLEELMLGRTRSGLFDKAPRSIAFIKCLGSRDQHEGGLYCSRVCCSYSTRSAKVIRSYYPDCEIVFFYMELQNVEAGDYYSGLREMGMEFIKCRPINVYGGTPATVEYDDPVSGIRAREFDLIVLSDGIHAGTDNDRLAEICRLGQDKDGFLQAVGTDSGIYLAGCARAPMKIDEAYADSLAVAGMRLN